VPGEHGAAATTVAAASASLASIARAANVDLFATFVLDKPGIHRFLGVFTTSVGAKSLGVQEFKGLATRCSSFGDWRSSLGDWCSSLGDSVQ